MLKSLLALSVTGIAAVTASTAQAQNYYNDIANVVSVRPVYSQSASAPRQECWDETITTDRRVISGGYSNAGYQPYTNYGDNYDRGYYEAPRSSGAGTVIGAIIGGVVGRQFGNSHGGRNAGTVAGAVIGGAIGNHAENNNRYYNSGYNYGHAPARVDYIPETRTVQRCQTVYDQGYQQISAYDVTYVFNGREYNTRMSYDPGPTLRVNVDVQPERGYRR